jgi:hypothetical protein
MKRIDYRSACDNRDGATSVVVAICLVALISMAAIAVDLGMLYTARSEAQRVADASAHAGAAEFFRREDAWSSMDDALEAAVQFAEDNTIRGVPVNTTATTGRTWAGGVLSFGFDEGLIEVFPADMRVRATLTRTGIATWFARVFGVEEAGVSASATAAVRFAGSATCVKPFAIPDAWDDRNNDGMVGNQPANDPATGEYYKRFEWNPGHPPSTGFGSAFRNHVDPQVRNDWGRKIRLRAGNQATTPGPSMYFSWELPDDGNMPKACPAGTGGSSTFQLNICSCNMNPIGLGTTYSTLTGAAMGWVRNGLGDLIDQDPHARWDPVLKEVVGSDPKYGHWTNSPRVITVPLFDPRILLTQDEFKSGKQDIVFNNFASLFIEAPDPGSGQNSDIFGRFLPIARGVGTVGAGQTAGSLVRILQIIE